MDQLKNELQQLHDVLNKIESPVIFAHNDLLLGNILVDEKTDGIRFIDYEYAAYNFQAYDIGNHFAEYAGSLKIEFTYMMWLVDQLVGHDLRKLNRFDHH